MALAMDAAHSTNPSVYNGSVTKVTSPAPGATIVHTYAGGQGRAGQGQAHPVRRRRRPGRIQQVAQLRQRVCDRALLQGQLERVVGAERRRDQRGVRSVNRPAARSPEAAGQPSWQELISAVGFGVVTARSSRSAPSGSRCSSASPTFSTSSFGSVMTLSGFIAYWLNRDGMNIWLAMVVAALVRRRHLAADQRAAVSAVHPPRHEPVRHGDRDDLRGGDQRPRASRPPSDRASSPTTPRPARRCSSPTSCSPARSWRSSASRSS